MISKDTYFEEYRSGLAGQLFLADRQRRKEIFETERKTLCYRLSKGERLALRQGAKLDSPQIESQKKWQGNVETYGNPQFFMSNEPALFRLFPLLRNLHGGAVGVGSDQMLDIFVNGGFNCACLVDYTLTTSLLSRSLLEVGSRHRKVFGNYPTTEEFIEYFQPDNLSFVDRALAPSINPHWRGQLFQVLHEGYYGGSGKINYADYLQYKLRASDDRGKAYSWLGSQDNLARTLQAYDAGRIAVIHGDIGDRKVFDGVRQFLQLQGCKLGVLYMSNAEGYRVHDGQGVDLSPYLSVEREADALLLRTMGSLLTKSEVPSGDDSFEAITNELMMEWHYNAQTLNDFRNYADFSVEDRYSALKRDINRTQWDSNSSMYTGRLKGYSFLGLEPEQIKETYHAQ